MDLSDEKYFLNKQLSWLNFNKRVLEEANEKSTPLLEKLTYIAITSTNLDEFFMVRVARLKGKIESNYNEKDKSGYRPRELLSEVSKTIHKIYADQYEYFTNIINDLKKESIIFKDYKQLSKTQLNYIKRYFKEVILPVLTPVAIDPSHPFPLIANKSLNLGVLIERKEGKSLFSNIEDENIFSLVEVPANLNRFISLPSKNGENHFIYLEEVIKNNLHYLFSGYDIIAADTFRITRNAEVLLDEDSDNLLSEMQKYVKRRRWGFTVRLEVKNNMNEYLLNFLMNHLDIDERDIYKVNGPVNLGSFMSFKSKFEDKEDLKFKPLIPQPNMKIFDAENIFDLLKKEDVILHHPFESFDPVLDLIEKSASDPKVLAIKQTLYRVSGDSPIIEHLTTAAENGKQVTVLVELKARFDEANNIAWAKKLEEAGCHVVYGIKGLKVHSKALLIVRSESEGIRRYVHLSTGNYNDKTAKLYTDVGLITSKENYASDISGLFNLLTGYSKPPQWRLISVAPLDMRTKFIELIENEIKNVKSGLKGQITAKMNALVDRRIIEKLYEASMTGVQIDLIVRGICCLMPGHKEVSQNIRVRSIVGKLLEHSRLFYFYNNNDPIVYLSSADWRPRNLDRRVEIAFPIENKTQKRKIINILETVLQDNQKAHLLLPTGEYEKIENDKDDFESQLELYKQAKQKFEEEVLNNNIITPNKYVH